MNITQDLLSKFGNFKAIAASAASVICVHNHPSGNPEPSGDDLDLTNA